MRKLVKPDTKSNSLRLSRQRKVAHSRWDCEGGAEPSRPQVHALPGEVRSAKLQLTNNELAQLRIRVIALENLVIALFADAPDRQLKLVREMAAYVSPRPGFTRHSLTINAAAQMIHIVERAVHFRVVTLS
jgi:hypothetical protein